MMNFEDIQKNWQQQTEGKSIMIETDFLLKEVRRNKQSFDVTIFWRDVREAGGSFAIMLLFIYWAIKDKDIILLYPILACLFVGTFMVIDRIKLKKKYPYNKKNTSLIECVRISLVHVNHQIWLLKNVAWWYLLPFAIGVSIPFFERAWHLRNSDSLTVFLIKTFGFVIVLYIGIYYLNQYAVKKVLVPRRDELQDMLKSIQNDSSEDKSN
jgi:hypothetical protein